MIFTTLLVVTFHTVASARISLEERIQLLKDLNHTFRSSSYAIDASIYPVYAFNWMPDKDLRNLRSLTPMEIVNGFKKCNDCKPDKAVVENVIKMSLLLKADSGLNYTSEISRGHQIDQEYLALNYKELLKDFPEPNAETKSLSTFDYKEYLIKQKSKADPLDNDLYNYRMAFVYFSEGMHKTHQSTFRVFSRGHKKRNFIVSMGQDQVLDMIQTLHFTEHHIHILQQSGKFPLATEAFWNYLRNFKFTGSIRMVPAGTIVFKDEAIMELTGNPVELSILETLISPIISKMTNYATAAAILTEQAGGRLLAEAGGRRGAAGFFSALAAVVAGFEGTSNISASYFADSELYGSQAHQLIGHFVEELRAHSIYNYYFPNVTLLVDTFDILEGVKKAVLAVGPDFTSLRLDSAIPGIADNDTEAEHLTTIMVESLLEEMGHKPGSYKVLYSNKLSAINLRDHTRMGSKFHVAVVGSELAAPSETPHMNVVYKLVELIKIATQEKFFGIKLSPGKMVQPGKTSLWRKFDKNGIMSGDKVSTDSEESLPRGYVQLTIDGMIDGVRKVGRESKVQLRERIQKGMNSLPADLKKIEISETPYQFSLTPGAKKVLNDTIRSIKNKKSYGVYGLSADPIHDAHVELIKQAALQFSLTKLYIVVTGDERVHKGKPMFTAAERLAMVKQRFPEGKIGNTKLVFWTGEIEGRTAYTVDTLREISRKIPDDSQKNIWVFTGEAFNDISDWKNPDELINNYNWAVAKRTYSEPNPEAATAIAKRNQFLEAKGFVPRSATFHGPNGNYIIDVDFNLPPDSSTEFRNSVKNVDTIFQIIDPQVTFWKGMHGLPDGPLAVPGTSDPRFVENYKILTWISKHNPKVKSITSGDEHFTVEYADPETYLEMKRFGAHAMAGEEGALGDGLIPEVQLFSKDNILEVKHHKEAGETLELIPFDMNANADKILDPNFNIYIRKNGAPTANSLWVNPYAEKIYRKINPKFVYAYGVATEFCYWEYVEKAAKLAKEMGFTLYVIEDAIAGIFPEQIEEKIKLMKSLDNVFFVTTDDVIKAHGYTRAYILRELEKEEQIIKIKEQDALRNKPMMCENIFGA